MHIYCFAHSKPIINFLGIKFSRATKVTIVHDSSKDDRMERHILGSYLTTNGYKAIDYKCVNYLSEEDIQGLYASLSSENILILPPIEHARHINLFRGLPSRKFNALFIENDGDIYSVDGDGIHEFPNDDVKLNVKDFIAQTSGHIMNTNNALFDQGPAKELLAYFLKNLEVLKPIIKSKRPMVKEPTPKYGTYYNSPNSIFYPAKLEDGERRVYIGALELLEAKGILDISRGETEWFIMFNAPDYREYFTKSGTWLEHYTYDRLKKIQGIRDVNSSVLFVWDDEMNIVRNELDVMAITDNQLIAISCKDTNQLDDDYLYELESHADNLATEEAIKVIVTTQEPNRVIANRADQLDIAIIVYDGQDSSFMKALQNVIR